MLFIPSCRSKCSFSVIHLHSKGVRVAFLIEQACWQKKILPVFVYLKRPLFHFYFKEMIIFQLNLLWYNWVYVLVSLVDALWRQNQLFIPKGQHSAVDQSPNPEAWIWKSVPQSTTWADDLISQCLFPHITNEQNKNSSHFQESLQRLCELAYVKILAQCLAHRNYYINVFYCCDYCYYY